MASALVARDTASPSLMSRVEPVQAGAHVLHAGFLGAEPVLATVDGVWRAGVASRPHGDAGLLCAALAPDPKRPALLTGGADGRVMRFAAGAEPETLNEAGAGDAGPTDAGPWIDAVAAGPNGAVAWTAARAAHVRDGKGRVSKLELPSASQGLAFFSKGLRVAVARNGGASLWFPFTEVPPDALEWKGSHLDVTVSPDNRFVVTSMQETALHGWRLPEKAHMRMSGYPGKTRSFSWSSDGLWLATSGAEAAIIWPFKGEGPMGKAPRECGVRRARVTAVSFHPRSLVLALGYADGFVMLCRLTDAAELPVRREGGDAITALGWDATGRRLLFGAADGAAGLLTLPG